MGPYRGTYCLHYHGEPVPRGPACSTPTDRPVLRTELDRIQRDTRDDTQGVATSCVSPAAVTTTTDTTS